MGVRNGKNLYDTCDDLTPELVDELMEDWQQNGKVWDISPPGASHVGGVWERKIGQIRQMFYGYLCSYERKTLSQEELMTLLQEAARIVNSTPIWEAPDSSNDAQPITPFHLITQRDENQGSAFIHPTVYSPDDLRAYGAQRHKRVQALANEFAEHWKRYMYEIGDCRDKWNEARRNAEVGDLVLIMAKDNLKLKRLEGNTGTIIEALPDRDGLVRSVTVQPHKRPNERSEGRPKKMSIHYLVLLKEVHNADTSSDTKLQEIEDGRPTQEVLLTVRPEEMSPELELQEMFGVEKIEKRPLRPNPRPDPSDSYTEKELGFLNATAEQVLDKITRERKAPNIQAQ